MNLSTKAIHLFLELQKVVNDETSEIFGPIIEEVERQDKEAILSLPIESTTWVEWLINSPKGSSPEFNRHLLLMVQLTPFLELNLVLIERYEAKKKKIDWVVFQEYYRINRIEQFYGKTFSKVWEKEADNDGKPKPCPYINHGIDELARFPLKGKISAIMIAEKIILEAKNP